MHEHTEGLSGPDFLESVADAEAANGLAINADIYRQRAREWKRDREQIEALQAANARLQRTVDRARRELLVA